MDASRGDVGELHHEMQLGFTRMDARLDALETRQVARLDRLSAEGRVELERRIAELTLHIENRFAAQKGSSTSDWPCRWRRR